MALEFRVFGPLEVRCDEGHTPITARQQRVLLALLLANRGAVTPISSLVEALWPGDRPAEAEKRVQIQVYRLRRALGAADVVRHRPPGYALDVPPEHVDLHRFDRLLAEGVRAARVGDHVRAAEAYASALALYRGPAFQGLDDVDALADEAQRLVESRLEALEGRIDAELALGGGTGALVGDLIGLVAEHPLRERFRAQLMTTLYRSGRAADALEVYRDGRRLLHDELGIEPSAECQALHRVILRGEPSPDQSRAARSGPRRPDVQPPAARRPVPAELPADVPAFSGRGGEVAQLDALLESRDATGVVVAISGTPGVGKTALAVHWAHRVADRFPDGQLYVNLHGYDPDPMVAPADALGRLLCALGVAERDLSAGVDERAAQFRTEVARRQLLIVLDNAGSVEQVRPLLPGGGCCAVLVTSRDSLAGLVAVHGACRLDLRPLPEPDAVGLLAALIGPRVTTEPGAAAALAEQCARLPLALRIAAELAVSRPTTRLSELVVELDGQAQRLELLDAGADPRAAVATVFSWSTRHLPADAARTFALLGLHHGPDFDAYAVAALAGTEVSHAATTLRILSNAHLVHPTGIGRYGMHDLLRAYAARVARGSAGPDGTETALGRLFDFYLAAAAAAADRLFPAESHRRPRGCSATTPLPELNDTRDARAWLDHELPTLVRFAEYAAQHGWPRHAIRLSPTLFRYLASGRFTDAMRIHESACRAARAVGDPAGEGHALLGLCEASYELMRTGAARRYAHQALSLFHQLGDRMGEARARYSLGMIDWVSGRYASAARHAAPALELARRAEDHTGEAKAYTLRALISLDRGELDNAKNSLQRALALHRRWADRTGEAYTLHNLGCVEHRLHRYVAAATLQQNALTLFQRLGNRVGEANTLDALGAAHAVLGRRDDATRCLDTAVSIADEIGDRRTGSSARNNLGEIATAAGEFADALVHHTAAHAIASGTDAPAEQARSHAGRGRAYLAMGEREQARIHLVLALNVYRELHLPEADEIDHLLASLAAPEGPDRRDSVALAASTVHQSTHPMSPPSRADRGDGPTHRRRTSVSDRPARRAWRVRVLDG